MKTREEIDAKLDELNEFLDGWLDRMEGGDTRIAKIARVRGRIMSLEWVLSDEE